MATRRQREQGESRSRGESRRSSRRMREDNARLSSSSAEMSTSSTGSARSRKGSITLGAGQRSQLSRDSRRGDSAGRTSSRRANQEQSRANRAAGSHSANDRSANGRGTNNSRSSRGAHSSKNSNARSGSQSTISYGEHSIVRGDVPQLHNTQRGVSGFQSRGLSLGSGLSAALSRFNLRDVLGSAGLIAPIAGAIVIVFVLIQIVGCMASALTPINYYNGNLGITSSPLFASSSETAFQADLLVPAVFAPARPGKATVTGTVRDTGSAGDNLSTAIKNIESNGYEVGFALYDVNTGITVTYNADSSFYSASSIKGPYVVALAKYELGDSVTSESNRITNILQWSDNDSYSNMRDAYGNSSFASLVDASGASAMSAAGATEAIANAAASQSSDNIADNKYEFFSANQLLAIWRECYNYLSSNEPGASWLADAFTTPEISAIKACAGSLCTTWSKAGWYPEGTAGYGTTVDAGVIRTNTGDVVLCVMTNDPEDFSTLESIISPLMAVRATLTN